MYHIRMVVVVSGHRRSGTSAMMKALRSGGMDILYSPSLEKQDEKVSPGGIWEVGLTTYMNPKFLRLIPDDVAIKIMWDGIVNLPKGDWKIIFMERDEDEINASAGQIDTDSAIKDQLTANLPFCCFRKYDRDNIDHVLGIMDTRIDVEVIPVNYQDLISDPQKVFNKIKYRPSGKVRIPIDVEKASAVIDKTLYRVRKP